MQAILYSRWSSLEQSGTTSAPRQLELTGSCAERNGWTVVERLSDQGKSAWTGDNIRTGELGRLVERLEREGGTGRVLIVEKLDRLSRQPPLVMAAWVQRACATGLVIVTADNAHRIDAAGLVNNQMMVLGLIFEAFRGYQESQAKSERVGEAWAHKRARGAAMTRQCPAWLTIDAKDTGYKSATNVGAQYKVIEERAAIIRQIFDWTIAGVGKSTIAAKLNAAGVPVFGRGNGWHASYIQKIVHNASVIGEYQPHTKPKGATRKPIGEPIRDYFPSVVPVEIYERANDSRASRVLAQQSGKPLVNMLSGLTFCTACGSSMTLVGKGNETLIDGTVVPRRYLKCSSAHRSNGCKRTLSFEYYTVENAILDQLLHLAMDDQHFAAPSQAGSAKIELIEAKRTVTIAERREQVAYAEREDDPDSELATARYRQRRDELKTAREAVKRLEGEVATLRGAVSPAAHIARVADVRAMMNSEDADERYKARSSVKLALNDLVEGIGFDGRKQRWTLSLTTGARRITFSRDGTIGFDLDWTKLAPKLVKAEDPAIAAYLRRKEA